MTTGAIPRDNLFDGRRVLVTGGTGSLGRALVRRLLSGEVGRPAAVTVFSRDEGKQHDMRMAFHGLSTGSEDAIYRDYADILRFWIGDVRDFDAVARAMRGVDVVFHAAALKQVPTCEYHPGEAVATNVHGAENITRAIERAGLAVEAVIGISTDKACMPVNVMGMTKALQERVLISAGLHSPNTRFVCARYGNVLASRGSVVPVFHSQIRAGGPVTVTMPEMTRFLLTQRQAIDTVLDAFRSGRTGETFVPRVPAARVVTLAECLIGDRDVEIAEVGIRPGEKVHEILVAVDEARRTVARDGYYVIRPALPELQSGEPIEAALAREYGSEHELVGHDEVTALLRTDRLRVEDRPDFAGL